MKKSDLMVHTCLTVLICCLLISSLPHPNWDEHIDAEIFNRKDLLTLKSPPRLISLDKQAEFEFTLKLGPRSYKTAFNKIRQLDAKNIQIYGEIIYQGDSIARCSGFVSKLNSHTQHDQYAPEYFAKVKTFDYTEIPVRCSGSSMIQTQLADSAPFGLNWHATMALVGDREAQRKFGGSSSGPMFGKLLI
jgi:hypothetical protein